MDERRLLVLETKLRNAVIPDPGRVRQMLAELWTVSQTKCPIEFDFHVTDATTGADVSGATIVVKDGTGAVVATLTTDSGGLATANLVGVDAYTATVSKTLYNTQTVTPAATACGGVTAVAVAMVEQTCTYTFGVSGCSGQAVPGATITITGVGTLTTNSSGNASVTLTTTGSKSYTVSAGRMNDVTGTIDGPPSCGTSSVPAAMTNADLTNFRCTTVCPLPVATDLTASGNFTNGLGVVTTYGPTTITEDGTGTWRGTDDAGHTITWNGSNTVTCSGPGGTYTGPGVGTNTCPTADGTVIFKRSFINTGGTMQLTE